MRLLEGIGLKTWKLGRWNWAYVFFGSIYIVVLTRTTVSSQISQYYLEADACLSSIMLVSLRWSSSSEGVLFVGGWLLLSSCSRARLRLLSPAPCFSISLMSRSFYKQKKPLLLKPIHMNCVHNLQGCALRKIEGSPVLWTCEIQGTQHLVAARAQPCITHLIQIVSILKYYGNR